MDEPLSNLDARLRLTMRGEIKRLCHRLGATTLYVTHDQAEALTMADLIAVMRDGELQQLAPPDEIYDRPANRFVATFVGSPPMNLLARPSTTMGCTSAAPTLPLDTARRAGLPRRRQSRISASGPRTSGSSSRPAARAQPAKSMSSSRWATRRSSIVRRRRRADHGARAARASRARSRLDRSA